MFQEEDSEEEEESEDEDYDSEEEHEFVGDFEESDDDIEVSFNYVSNSFQQLRYKKLKPS